MKISDICKFVPGTKFQYKGQPAVVHWKSDPYPDYIVWDAKGKEMTVEDSTVTIAFTYGEEKHPVCLMTRWNDKMFSLNKEGEKVFSELELHDFAP